ncbi:unnamed protein product [Ilex paraguariensis]|uniref:Pentatricopeptide repeat-containing protein n=1 Tax=Ilex paraguariensis TaxID=185542 RepID=A0ABC8V3E4_9AQUA
MSLCFHAIPRRYILKNTITKATHRSSHDLPTHNRQSPQPELPLIFSNYQSFTQSENNPESLHLELLAQLQNHGSEHTPYIFNKVVSFCSKWASLDLGIQLHSKIVKLGFDSNVYINSALVDTYCKCGFLSCGQQLFDEMPRRNAVTWNSLLSGYLQALWPEMATELFMEMIRTGIAPTPFSVSAILVGCAQLEDGELGAQVHSLSLKAGFCSNVVVGTGLIHMYSKCANVEASRRLFDQMPDKSVVSWTSMITGYAQNHQPDEAMMLVREMLCLGIKANYVTYNSLLSSFCHPDDLDHCKHLHCHILKEGLESNAYLAVTLVTVYSDCGCSLEEFYRICSSVMVWDQISWNAVISGFSNIDNGEEAFICFSRMRQAGIDVDLFTFTSILKAMGISSALEEGTQIQTLVFKTGYASNVCVQNGLVSMYARCGKIDYAKRVFFSMDHHDVISWNSLLSACAQHGYGREAVEMFEHMRRSGVKPNSTTFLAVLSACGHVGLLHKGLEYFNFMKNDDSVQPPKVEHYACVVDLYGRAGFLHEAEAFINSMPIDPGSSVFKALLSACQVHGNKEIARRAARKLVELSPNDPATYVLLSNVLATGGYWDDAAGVRKIMCDKGVRKKPGYSWI